MVDFKVKPFPIIDFSRLGSQGTKVTLAGRPALLPNADAPIVVQRLTMGQINAIPKEHFSVSLIDPSIPVAMSAPNRGRGGSGGRRFKGGGQLSGGRLQWAKRLARQTGGNGIIRFVQQPSGTIAVENNGTKLFTTIIAQLDEVKENVDSLYYTNRRLSRNPGGDPPSSGIFLTPIDEGKMSDCIKRIILDVFSDGDIGKICGRKTKLVEFCLLMHYYFRRIKILKNTSRQPFCEYLENYVFKDESRFTAKTFNNYANDASYKRVEEDFTDPSRVDINFKKHPTPKGTLQDAFHEIGYFFHNSPYFDELRDIRDNIDKFGV